MFVFASGQGGTIKEKMDPLHGQKTDAEVTQKGSEKQGNPIPKMAETFRLRIYFINCPEKMNAVQPWSRKFGMLWIFNIFKMGLGKGHG